MGPMRSQGGPGGRPRTFDTDAVVDAVLDLFWRKGFRATTTRDLEAELGLGPSSIYNAFGSKQAMLEAALDRYETRVDGEIMVHLESGRSGLAAIDSFLGALGRWVSNESRGCLVVNLMAESGPDPEVAARTRTYRMRVRKALRGALRRAADSGEIAPEDVDSRADLLLSSILGLDVAARGGASAAELRRLLTATRSQVKAWAVN